MSTRKVLPQFTLVQWALLLLGALTLYRFWFATRLELVPDEAYYWLWSKHLAASYRDKGPAIGWTVAFGTWLFGDTVFAIRFFAVVCSTGIGWMLFELARRMYDDRVAWWTLLVAVVMPMMAVGAILMTIDSLSLLFWALGLLLFWQALQRDNLADWFWLGLAIGLGFLAKFTNGVQLACIGLFLLWSREHRPLLFSRKMVVLCAAFLISILPLLWWNYQNGWVHVTALHSRSGVRDSFGVHPGELFRFIGEQFGVVSPLFMAGLIIATVLMLWQRHADLRMRFLLCHFVPLYGVFLFFSLNKSGKANWAAPALLTGLILMVVCWRDLVARRPAWRWGIGAAFGVAFIMTLVAHDTSYLHLPPSRDPLRRAQGWTDFARHVQRARTMNHTDVLIGDHYAQASVMSFYLADHPTTYLPPEPFGKSQFTLWPTYEVTPPMRALFVTDSLKPPPDALQEQFNKIEMVDDFWSQHRGRPMTHFRIYLCTDGHAETKTNTASATPTGLPAR